MNEVTVAQLKEMMDNNEDFQLIDVRETYEYEVSNLGGELIPISSITSNIDKISKEKPVVIHCRTGGRSGQVVMFLMQQYGYTNVYNLRGGISAWAMHFDPTMRIG